MIRGTTAQFKFKLPCTVDELALLTVTFWQPGNDNFETITRDLSHCSKSDEDDYCVCVSLQPSDTLKFSDKMKAKVQLKAQYGSTVFASRQQTITVYPINDNAIGDVVDPLPVEKGWIIFDGKEVIE